MQLALDLGADLESLAPPRSHRRPILRLLRASGRLMTGREIARATGIPYKKVIDTLNLMHNAELVVREGRKFTAKWGDLSLRRPDPFAGASLLEATFRGFFKR